MRIHQQLFVNNHEDSVITELAPLPALEKGDKVAIIGTSGGVQEFTEVLEKVAFSGEEVCQKTLIKNLES